VLFPTVIEITWIFPVLTAVSIKIAVFSVVFMCNLVDAYQHFRDVCCLPRRQQSSGIIKVNTSIHFGNRIITGYKWCHSVK
jgi:hypothetical protein